MCVCVCVCVCVVCGGYEYSRPVVSSSGQALPSSKEVKATMSTLASKPLPQQSGDHSNVRQRHIERVISPASPVCVCVCVCGVGTAIDIMYSVCGYLCT